MIVSMDNPVTEIIPLREKGGILIGNLVAFSIGASLGLPLSASKLLVVVGREKLARQD